jgi:hypothetical protein
MSRSRCLLTILCPAMLAAAAARADEGLKLPGSGVGWTAWPSTLRFHATLHDSLPRSLASLTPIEPARRAAGASLIGDYYLFGAPEDIGQTWTAGLRASSGLLIRPPGLALNDLALSSRATAAGAPALRPYAAASFGPAIDPAAEGVGTLPYVGVGYSGQLVQSGWGFWADVGLVVQSPGGALGLGRVVSGSQGVDDLVRELRLSPMLQLGVSYSF